MPLQPSLFTVQASLDQPAFNRHLSSDPARRELVFIESNVADLQTLLQGLAGSEVHILDASQDGLHQMAQIMAGRENIDAVHLISHGDTAAVNLGTLTLDNSNLGAHQANLQTIGASLATDGDITLYGCNIGAGADGAALVQSLATITGADIAASSNLTGAPGLGGDWALEVHSGPVASGVPLSVPAMLAYHGTLATGTPLEPTVTGNYDSNVGLALLSNGGHADLYLHQIGGDNSYLDYASPPQYAAKVVVADGANHTVQTLTVSGSDYVTNAAITKLSTGGFVVSWSADTSAAHDYSSFASFFQVYDNAGAAQGSVQSLGSAGVNGVGLTALADGGFAAAYVKSDQTTTLAIYGYDSGHLALDNSTTFGGSTTLYSNGVDTGVTLRSMSATSGGTPTVLQLSDGSIVVTDATYVYGNSGYTPIGEYAFKFTSDGQASQFASGYFTQRLNWSFAVSSESGQHAIALSGGGFAVASLVNTTVGGTTGYELILLNNDGTPVDATSTVTHSVMDPGVQNPTYSPKTYYAQAIGASYADPNIPYGAARFNLTESSDGKILIALPNSSLDGLNIYTYSAAGVLAGAPVDAGITASPGYSIERPVLAPGANGGYAISYDETHYQIIHSSDPADTSDYWLYTATPYSYGVPYSAVPNTAPTFVGATTTLDAPQNSGALDLAALLHASDTDSSQILTWSQSSAPAHGTLSIAGATASSGTADLTPGGSITYTPAAGFAGTDTLTVQVSDGAASATRTITINVAPATPGALDLANAADHGASHTDNLTNAATLTVSGSGGAGDSSSSVRVFIDANNNGVYDAGEGNASATLNNGAWSVSGVSTAGLADGTYHLYAITTSATGGVASAHSAALDVTIDKTAPLSLFSALTFSADTGIVGDFVTGTAAQTIGATLNGTLAAGDTVWGSLDNGVSWTDITSKVSGATLSWNGVTLTGAGTLQLKVTDAAGNDGTTASQPYTLDTGIPSAPTALALDPGSDSGTAGDGISNHSTPAFSGSGEAGALVRLYADGNEIGYVNADGLGGWSINSSTLTEGAHTITATQSDLAGNVSAVSAEFDFVLDSTAPSSFALSTTTVTLNNASSGATLASLTASDATARQYALATGSNGNDADNGKFTISGTSLVAAQSLTAGAYHIYLSVTDAAGNATLQAFTVNVVDAPGVSSIVRAGGASSPVAASATSVTYTVTFDQSVTGVDDGDFVLSTDGNASGNIGVTGSGSVYTVTVSAISGDGSLRLDLKSSGTGIQNGSAVGIAGGYTSGESFTLDHTAPLAPAAPVMTSATDSGASNSDAITSDTTPTFAGTAEAYASVTLYDTLGGTLGTATANASGDWEITSSTLTAGSHTLTVKQTDAAGNVSPASGSLLVQIDTSAAAPAAPLLAVVSDTGVAGDHITSVLTPTISGSAEAFASVTLYDTNGTTALGTASADSSGAWSITSSTLSEAAHTLTVKQTDRAGNVSAASAALTLTIDATAPAAPAAPTLASASDSGIVGDGITNASQPVFTGSAEAGATVRLYDSNGTTLLGTATANNTGAWSITSSTLALGAHTLTVKQTDAAGNVSPASAGLTLNLIAPPAPPATTVDGVQVVEQPVTLPGGGTGTQTTIPVVTSDRPESSGSGGVADIPLAMGSDNSELLLAQLPVGFGLSAAGGASQPAGSSLETLIAAILAATPDHTSTDQGHLTGNGANFLSQLAASVPLLVQTITPVSGASAPTGTLTLTGTSTSGQHTALVIDVSGLPAGSSLTLNAVDFAAIIGSANVSANTTSQILTGDIGSQQFTVSAGSASAVFAGGGNDSLVFMSSGAEASGGAARAQAAARSADTVILHGGLGEDGATFNGAAADYTVENHNGYLIVTANAQPTQHALVINAETLKFSDATVAVQNDASLSTLAGLYHDVLGRQADYLGISYWSGVVQSGVSLGQVALSMINSAESQSLHAAAFNGDSAHDIALLYQAIFSRAGDAGGLAFWVDTMAQGATLEQVAEAFATSAEMNGHKLAAQSWDFLV